MRTSESMVVSPMPRLFWMVIFRNSTWELLLTSAPRPPSKVMFWIPTRCDASIASRWPLALPGTTVAVGLPEIFRSVRPAITTFSWQVPVTVMLFGPAAGSDASASWMLVKAPGVAPLQSTTALAANARIDGKRTTSRQIDKSLGPEERIVIKILPSHFLSCSVKKSGENTLPWRNRAAKGVVRQNEKCFKKDRKK